MFSWISGLQVCTTDLTKNTGNFGLKANSMYSQELWSILFLLRVGKRNSTFPPNTGSVSQKDECKPQHDGVVGLRGPYVPYGKPDYSDHLARS